MTTTATFTNTHAHANTHTTPRLILKTTNDNNKTSSSTALVTTSTSRSLSPIKTAFSTLLPPKPSRKTRLNRKHLRKPPSFDSYLPTLPGPVVQPSTPLNTPPYHPNISRRSNSLSSCSSISLEDNHSYPSFNREELIYAKAAVNSSSTSLNSIPQYQRSRRSSTTTKSVRFVGTEDDRSSISSSLGSSGSDDWDHNDFAEEDEEEFYTRQSPIPPIQLQEPAAQLHAKFYST
ncbi:13199_t:CDS:1 [Dentiscutata erythropus]|uniref:13199_t:CDS:1 n=1 Tax=Dentiscutata erythropus TaxID=1348616 RepID=A0A9N9FAQ6_9GLOM|nr:13199_t:CDS:1 [Dentiscutata erythropus]